MTPEQLISAEPFRQGDDDARNRVCSPPQFPRPASAGPFLLRELRHFPYPHGDARPEGVPQGGQMQHRMRPAKQDFWALNEALV